VQDTRHVPALVSVPSAASVVFLNIVLCLSLCNSHCSQPLMDSHNTSHSEGDQRNDVQVAQLLSRSLACPIRTPPRSSSLRIPRRSSLCTPPHSLLRTPPCSSLLLAPIRCSSSLLAPPCSYSLLAPPRCSLLLAARSFSLLAPHSSLAPFQWDPASSASGPWLL